MEAISARTHRHEFPPSGTPITVERDLRRVCAAWQSAWDNRLQDHVEGAAIQPPVLTAPETLKQAYDHHQEHYAALLGNRTREQYPARMQDWFEILGPEIRLEEITAEVILAARTKMQKAKGSSNTTINGKVATLKKILNMAHRKGWVSKAPWQDVPPLRVIRSAVRFWNADQIVVAYRVAAQDTHPETAVLMLTLGIHLGLRKNEAVNDRRS